MAKDELAVNTVTPTELEQRLSNDDLVAFSKAQTPENSTLRGLKTLDEVLAFLDAEYGGVVDVADQIGDGFAMIDDKGQLVGREMVLINWKFNESSYGDEPFVFVRAMTRDGQRIMFVDGSTGIRDDLLEFSSRTGQFGSMHLHRGLRRSDYDYTDAESGKTTKATTFYLDTSL
jgi:hypothetical protein